MVDSFGGVNHVYEPQMKYITAAVMHPGRDKAVEHIFIFPEFINHNHFASSMRRMRDSSNYGREQPMEFQVVGAGFTDGQQCWGRSETLNCNSRGAEDAKLIPHISLKSRAL